MCTVIHFGNDEAETKAELRALIGIEPVMSGVYPSDGFEWRDTDCLCPCDEVETAKKAGLNAKKDRYGDYVFTRPAQ